MILGVVILERFFGQCYNSLKEKGKDKGNQTTELPVAGEKMKRNKEETQKREERELNTQFGKSQCYREKEKEENSHNMSQPGGKRKKDKGTEFTLILRGQCGNIYGQSCRVTNVI